MLSAVVQEAKGLDIEGPNALVLDSGPEVLCHNLLVWALLS
jgi:hypothetical protein